MTVTEVKGVTEIWDVSEVKGVTQTRDTAMIGTSKMCQGNKGQDHDRHQSNV